MRLTDDTDIMERHSLAKRRGLKFAGSLELLNGSRVFLLSHQRIAQIVDSLRILWVLLYRLTIGNLGIGEVALPEQAVALTDELTVGLGLYRRKAQGRRYQEHEQEHSPLAALSKKRHILECRILTVEDAHLNDQEQEHNHADCLELLIVVAKDCGIGLFLFQFIKLLVQQSLGIGIVINMDIGTATSLSHLTTHLLVEGRHHGVARMVLHIAIGARHRYGRTLW